MSLSFVLFEIVKTKKICVCVLEQVGKYRAATVHIPALSEFDKTIRGLLCHIACIQGYCGLCRTGCEWQVENGEQMSELGIVSISMPFEQDVSSILKGVFSWHLKGHLYFSYDEPIKFNQKKLHIILTLKSKNDRVNYFNICLCFIHFFSFTCFFQIALQLRTNHPHTHTQPHI